MPRVTKLDYAAIEEFARERREDADGLRRERLHELELLERIAVAVETPHRAGRDPLGMADEIDRLVEALEEIDERLDSLFSAVPGPQDDPGRWSQEVYFTRQVAERALAAYREAAK